MARAHLRIHSGLILGLLLAAPSRSSADGAATTSDDPAYEAFTTARSSFSPDPGLTVTGGDLLTAALVARTDDKVVTVGFTPFKLRDRTPLWGWQLNASSNTSTGVGTFGTSFRAEWRWIFDDAFSRAFERAAPSPGARYEAALLEAMDHTPIALLPVPTLGANVAVFPVDLEKDNDHAIAEYNVLAQLSWRLGIDVQADLAFARGKKRGAVDQADMADVQSAAATAVVLVPALLGASRYDDAYLAAGGLFQRGLGLGATVEHRSCLEEGADRARCPEGLLRSLFIGAVVDLRVTRAVSPRFMFGRRSFTKFDGMATAEQDAVEAGLVLAFSIKN